MKEYETILVARPDGSEAQSGELLEKVSGIIKRHSGVVLQQKNWGKRELAYKVQKYNQGIYHYLNYSGDSTTVAELERALKLHDLPIKYLTVKLSDTVDVEKRKKEILLAQEVAKAASVSVHRETKEVKESAEISVKEEEVKDA